MEANIVIKVKYGDTLRRLIAITYDNELEYDTKELREKFISLFNLDTGADLTLTYTDVDGDIVTLVDDDDVFDAVTRQRLNPFRINVVVNENKENIVLLSSPEHRNYRPKSGQSYFVSARQPAVDDNENGNSLIDHDPSFANATISSKKVEEHEAVTTFTDPTPKSSKKVEIINANKIEAAPAPTASHAVVAAAHTDSNIVVAPAASKTLVAPTIPVPAASKTVVAPAPPIPATTFDLNSPPGESITSKTMNVNAIPSAWGTVNVNTEEIGEGSNYHIKGISSSTGIKTGCSFPLRNSGFQYQGKPIPVYSPASNFWTPPNMPLKHSEPQMGRLSHGGVQCNGCGTHPIPVNKSSKPDSCFISHVTIMDGTIMTPSTRFSKIWRMRNTGDVAWFPGTHIIWSGGDKFSEANSVRVQGVPENGLSSGGEIDITINCFAPDKPGRYISFWQMALSSGERFGQPVRVHIQVVASMKDTLSNRFNLNLPPTSFESEPTETPFKAGVVEQHIPEPKKKLFISNNLSISGATAQTSGPTSDLHDFDSSGQVEERTVELILSKELEEILKNNDYNLGDSIEVLWHAEWDPLIEEWGNMGFNDTA